MKRQHQPAAGGGRASGALDRRGFIKLTGAGALGLGWAGVGAGRVLAAVGAPPAKAKSLIQLVLWGGMSQAETFDPKPKAAPEFRSAFKPIPTNVPGIEICELLPKLAQMADKYSILRTVLNPRTGHGDANYVMIANAPYPADIVSAHPTGKLVYPAVAAVVGMKKKEDGSYRGELPPWICVGKPPSGIEEGFLGPKWKAFSINPNGQAGLKDAERERLAARQALLAALEPGAADGECRAAARDAVALRDEVFRNLTSDARKVFDLTDEPAAVKERYGDTEFGRGCLLARRLAQYGVPSISVPWTSIRTKEGKQYGWDMHTELNASIAALCPILDQALSALLEDLDQRQLLDETIVVLYAENGKAPKFTDEDKGAGKPNGTKAGRHHWGKGFSVVVAGGGFKGGQAIGAMDDNGEVVQTRPIYPWDLWESVYLRLGIDPHAKLPNPFGCVAYVSQADACGLARGGTLTEIM